MKACQKEGHSQYNCHRCFFIKSLFLCMSTFPTNFPLVSPVYHLIMGVKNPGRSKWHGFLIFCLHPCRCTCLNWAFLSRSLIINTFFVNFPSVNFIQESQEYMEMLHHNFMQWICTGCTGIGYSSSIYYYYLNYLHTLLHINGLYLVARSLYRMLVFLF